MCKIDNLETFRNCIKPTPKYMIEKIKRLDKKEYPMPSGTTRFYTYFTKIKGELCSVTVAVRNKYKKWYCKQVVIHGLHYKNVYLRDIELTMGYIKVGWFRDGLTKYRTYHDYDWGYNDDKYFKMQTAIIVNQEYILSLPEFKYSAIDKFTGYDIFKYLRLYEKYPQAELLVKAGISMYATSKQILDKCSKDKNFCKWLYQNRVEISKSWYYIPTLLTAYKEKKELKYVENFLRFKKQLSTDEYYKRLREIFKTELERFYLYLKKQKTQSNIYRDYLTACEYLGVDMSEDKNRYPHNFKRWHDIRIDEYHSAKAEKDKQERKALYKKFEKIAQKYMGLQRTFTKDDYVCLIALSPNQLTYEGEQLHHCVGRMGYDQKFIREETLIFFVRNRLAQNTPFVTLEYSIEKKKVLQCYAEHNSKPNENVMEFVNKKWLPYANRKLKQLIA